MTHRTYGTNNALKHLIMKYENLGYNIPLAKPQYPHAPPPPQQWAPSQADRSELQTQHGIQAAWTRMTQLAAVHVRPSGGIWDIKSTIEKINKLKQKELRIVRAKGWTATQPHDARHPTSQSVSPLKLSQYNRNVILVKNWMLAEV